MDRCGVDTAAAQLLPPPAKGVACLSELKIKARSLCGVSFIQNTLDSNPVTPCRLYLFLYFSYF